MERVNEVLVERRAVPFEMYSSRVTNIKIVFSDEVINLNYSKFAHTRGNERAPSANLALALESANSVHSKSPIATALFSYIHIFVYLHYVLFVRVKHIRRANGRALSFQHFNLEVGGSERG